MPSFDVVCRADLHEVRNAVDQTNRELDTRFDFKGTNSRITQAEAVLTLDAPSKFQLEQVRDILHGRLAKRAVDLRALDPGKVEESGQRARQTINVRQGLDADQARAVVKRVKETKLKVQTAIQGDEVRVTGKSRDELQAVIAALRKAEDLELPLTFVNFRD